MDTQPPNYSREDLKSLYVYLSPITPQYSDELDFRMGLKNCMYKYRDLLNYPFKTSVNFSVFTTDMMNLPMYINNENNITAIVARWRLSIGK
jgi:hypothetical protein